VQKNYLASITFFEVVGKNVSFILIFVIMIREKRMPVISLSLNNMLLEEMERIREKLGYSGRSEAIRAGIRMFLKDAKEKESLKGRVKGILLVIHDHAYENQVTEIKHEYTDVIYTQLHNRFQQGKCLELFILDGEADRIKGLTWAFQRSGQNEYVKLILI
jgi:CopG family nickel-responsive transcriptional regulator